MQGVCVFFRKGIAEKLHTFFSVLNQSALLWYESLPHPALTWQREEGLFLRPDSEMVAASTKAAAAAPLGTELLQTRLQVRSVA